MNIVETIKTIGEDISRLSKEIGGGGESTGGFMLPIGSFISAFGNPIFITSDNAEFLHNGSVIEYSEKYANSVRVAPKLAVYGNGNEKQFPACSVAGSKPVIKKFKNKYYMLTGNSKPKTSTDLITWVADSTYDTVAINKNFAVSPEFIVMGRTTANGQPPKYSATPDLPSTFLPVSASFTPTSPPFQVLEYGYGMWVGASTVRGAAVGEIMFCDNPNPSVGTWKPTSSAMGMTLVTGIAISPTHVVFSGNNTAGNSSVLMFTRDFTSVQTAVDAPDLMKGVAANNVVFTGVKFIAISGGSLFAAEPGGKWLKIQDVMNNQPPSNYNLGTFTATGLHGDLFTDGNGLVGYVLINSTTGLKMPFIKYSLDHGETWAVTQYYPTAGIGTTSWGCWTGEELIVGVAHESPILNLGPNPFDTPDCIGITYILSQGEYVRIL